MKISDIKCHVTTMGGSWLTETVVANPMSIYPEYAAKRSSWYGKMTAAVIEVVLENGISGYGFVGGAKGQAIASAIDEQMRPLVVGKTVFQTELIHEQLSRASVFYGRGGFSQCAISGIDIALWDAKGKILGQPVYNLLGGKTREKLRTYYTGNDPTALRELGIKDMKIAIPYGPADGETGMRKNEEVVARARETLGPDAFIALDIYMAWNVSYTLKMYDRIRQYKIEWLEEPVPPDDYEGYAAIRRRLDTMVTGGEHEYTFEGFRRLIESGCVDIVQPDIYRAGGPTALKRIAALAKLNHVKLICHGIGSPTYHFQITNGLEVTPFVEYIDIYRHATRDWVLSDDPRPVNGELILAETPGFGYGLNASVFANHQQEDKRVTPIW